MGYIGAHGVQALHRYKYSGVDHSYVAKSNMITLTEFLFLVTSALLGYIYHPLLDTPPLRWVNFAHGLLLFLYQDVIRLHVQYVLFSSNPVSYPGKTCAYRFVFNLNSLKPWLLRALLCVDEMLSGSGLYQLFLSTSLLGKAILPPTSTRPQF